MSGLRRGVTLVSVLVLLSAIGAVVHEAAGAFGDRVRDGGAYAGMSRQDRLFLALRAYDVDLDVYLLALAHIPADATYALVTGRDTVVSSGIVLPKVDALAPYVFLPRRRVGAETADWVVSYGVRQEALAGLRFAQVYDTGNGRWVGRVQR